MSFGIFVNGFYTDERSSQGSAIQRAINIYNDLVKFDCSTVVKVENYAGEQHDVLQFAEAYERNTAFRFDWDSSKCLHNVKHG